MIKQKFLEAGDDTGSVSASKTTKGDLMQIGIKKSAPQIK